MTGQIKKLRHLDEVEVRFLGQVGAGSTVELADYLRRTTIPKPKWAESANYVATAQVCGDSLADEGIFDGDMLTCKVIFERQEITEGRLVVAKLPTGRSVVKRIFFSGENVILRSSNPGYRDMVFHRDDVEVEGIVKELIRKLQ